MLETKITQMEGYFAQQIAQSKAREQALAVDERQDEAGFEKVRGNVFDIFATVFSAARKACREESAMVDFFREKLMRIPQNWQDSLEKARAHDETEKAHLETIKLEAAARIRTKFAEIWGCTP